MLTKDSKSTASAAAVEALLPKCMLEDRVRFERRLRALRRRPGPRELRRLLDGAARSAELLGRRRRNLPGTNYPKELPLTARKDDILQSIKDHPVVIVAGETGSGKTTQLPKICLEAGCGLAAKIACTQPRRVAALSISRRIAAELNVQWGKEVGCKIRFQDETSPRTYIKMLTDGMLLAEIQNDPELWEYDAVIVDEAHERSLNIDFLLGYLRLLRRRRPDLKIVITSATIDTAGISRAFDGAPVIEVTGRMFPVEVRYQPLDQLLEESGDCTYIDAAISAVEQILEESPGGDLLVFMPSERDIRETRERLEGRQGRHVEVLPLFGRLTAAEQQRIFAPRGRRRIVVATNIAETSLTVPGIRYVIDVGLARISRYNPRTQTQRLPIEAISQSSAEQRKGRCGRLSGGVCIRLYDEADFLARPRFTQPEIQRANLAEVILRMMALKLGEIETFPFIDPPQPRAIRGGLILLEELGALDADRRLTPMGRDMASLPISPTVARMILQARREGGLRQVLAIAAAISIRDPRERPLEKQVQADQMHRPFLHPQSDFLTLLNIWEAYHDKMERFSQNQLRRFCKSHFLSYARMREWRDIHAQLANAMGETGGSGRRREREDYEAIHRSVLSGLLSNVACKKEHNIYRAARGREVMIFPGSGLFQKRPSRKNGAPVSGNRDGQGQAPDWIVAAEMVETSRLYARTAASIQPGWLAEVGRHLCRSSCKEPYWNARSGRVLVQETLTLHGLQVLSRPIPYKRIDPREATAIFIREALLTGDIRAQFPFLRHNLKLCHKIEIWQTRRRRREDLDAREAAFQFYARRLQEVSSLHDLNRLVRANRGENPRFLFMEEADLLGDGTSFDRGAFPDTMDIDGHELDISYANRPGNEEDGITLKLPGKLVDAVDPQVLEWLIPGMVEEKVAFLLRSLPKSIRRKLLPIPRKAAEIAAGLRPTHPSFLESLEDFISKHYRLEIHRSDWDLKSMPDHLRMRIQVQGASGKPVVAGRDLSLLVQRLKRHDTPVELKAWDRARAGWERDGLKTWDFDDLPERLEISRVSGIPLYGYPGLEDEAESVRLRLFKSREEAEAASSKGLCRLYRLELGEEMDLLRRQLGGLSRFKELYRSMGTEQELRGHAMLHLQRHLFEREQPHPLTRAAFEAGLQRARAELKKDPAGRLMGMLHTLLQTRRKILRCPYPYPEMERDIERLMPSDFLLRMPLVRLGHLCRYLEAVLVRAERAHLDPRKDALRWDQVRPYQRALDKLLGEDPPPPAPRRGQIQQLRWMLEEFRVSVFAQELGTDHPVSPKRLDRKLDEIESRE